MDLGIIAAVSDNGVIGNKGRLPFHIPEDLKRFKRITSGKPVIMGRSTYESIIASLGRPLPDRTSVVLSNTLRYSQVPNGVMIYCTLDEALQSVSREPEAWVIGGSRVYRGALSRANRLEITRVHTNCEGDTLFPEIPERIWEEVSRVKGNGSGGYDYDFVSYRRRS